MSNNRDTLLGILVKTQTIYFDDNYEALKVRIESYEALKISKMLITKNTRSQEIDAYIRYILMQ